MKQPERGSFKLLCLPMFSGRTILFVSGVLSPVAATGVILSHAVSVNKKTAQCVTCHFIFTIQKLTDTLLHQHAHKLNQK